MSGCSIENRPKHLSFQSNLAATLIWSTIAGSVWAGFGLNFGVICGLSLGWMCPPAPCRSRWGRWVTRGSRRTAGRTTCRAYPSSVSELASNLLCVWSQSVEIDPYLGLFRPFLDQRKPQTRSNAGYGWRLVLLLLLIIYYLLLSLSFIIIWLHCTVLPCPAGC